MPEIQTSSREGEVSGGGLRFRYREEGKGEVLLCLGRAGAMPRLSKLLAPNRRVVTLELPDASGRSSPSLCTATREAVSGLSIERFSLLARGDEAALALLLALDLPKEVVALILLGPTMIAANGEAAAGFDESLLARLETLAVPSLVAFGTKDRLAPPEAGRYYRARIPGCNLVFVYDAGPTMEQERPEAVAELIADFLARGNHFLVRQDDDVLYP